MVEMNITRFSATPRQWALMVVLSATLAGVLLWPGDDETPDSEVGEAMPSSQPAAPVAPTLAAPNSVADRQIPQQRHPANWPMISLAGVLARDPFAVLEIGDLEASETKTEASAPADAKPKPELREQRLNLEKMEVTAVFRDARGAVAAVGDRHLHVGDMLQGFRVIDIRSDAVVLEWVETE
jgi:hypothetical protein